VSTLEIDMDGSLPSFAERGAFIRSTHELADQIVELAGHLNAVNYRFLTLIAEFDRRTAWNCGATRDCAHWLNWKCGIDLGAAREKVRTAKALEALPLVSAAMQRGQISYSKVRALTRVATPENEHYFLKIALNGTADHVETLVRAYRRAKEAEELSREHHQQMSREVRYHWDDDGSRVGRHLRELPGARCGGNDRRRASPSRRPRFRGNVAGRRRTSMRDRGRSGRFRGNGPTTGLRCQPGRDRGDRKGRTAQRRSQDAQHPAGASARAELPRQELLSISGLHSQEVHRRSSHSIGRAVARRSCRISSRCAASTIARFTKAL
jgi:hypothetical protein